MVTPFQGIGGTSLQGSVTYVLRICVTDVLRRFCYLCPGMIQRRSGGAPLCLSLIRNFHHERPDPVQLVEASVEILDQVLILERLHDQVMCMHSPSAKYVYTEMVNAEDELTIGIELQMI